MEMWDIICEELNLKYRMLPPAATGFGALLANGTWTGMVGEMEAKVGFQLSAWKIYRLCSDRCFDMFEVYIPSIQ